MGTGWRARSRGRVREFGARHPRLAVVVVGALLAGLVAVCGLQLAYGTYLGRGWVIAALAGLAAAAGISAWALVSIWRHGGDLTGAVMTWLLLGLASASAIKFPFPRGRYDRVQAAFNVVHAALLGYEAGVCTVIVALLGYLLVRVRGGAPGQAVRSGALPSGLPGQAPRRVGLPARLRFPAAVTWQAGRLIVADGTVRWRSRAGDAEVDLTAACQAPALLPAAAQARQPRTTTLATASGLVEVDVSPRALASLARGLDHPPSGQTPQNLTPRAPSHHAVS